MSSPAFLPSLPPSLLEAIRAFPLLSSFLQQLPPAAVAAATEAAEAAPLIKWEVINSPFLSSFLPSFPR